MNFSEKQQILLLGVFKELLAGDVSMPRVILFKEVLKQKIMSIDKYTIHENDKSVLKAVYIDLKNALETFENEASDVIRAEIKLERKNRIAELKNLANPKIQPIDTRTNAEKERDIERASERKKLLESGNRIRIKGETTSFLASQVPRGEFMTMIIDVLGNDKCTIRQIQDRIKERYNIEKGTATFSHYLNTMRNNDKNLKYDKDGTIIYYYYTKNGVENEHKSE